MQKIYYTAIQKASDSVGRLNIILNDKRVIKAQRLKVLEKILTDRNHYMNVIAYIQARLNRS